MTIFNHYVIITEVHFLKHDDESFFVSDKKGKISLHGSYEPPSFFVIAQTVAILTNKTSNVEQVFND